MTKVVDMKDILAALQQLAAQNGVPQAVDKLARKDASILRTFKKRGITDVVLMDRSDRSKPFNVRPYQGWLANGRIVRKGQKSVKGLFHISQTDALPASQTVKPAHVTA
jgi:hypothetical protein